MNNPTNGHSNNNGERSSQNGVEVVQKKEPDNNSNRRQLSIDPQMDQSVVLKQSNMWAKAIAGTIIAVTVIGVIWAALATIEQVIAARGQLKPTGRVKEIQVPVNGLVKEVLVEDGERVKKDQLLLTLDTRATKAQLTSLENVRKSLIQESQFYAAVMSNISPQALIRESRGLKLPPEVVALARSRIALVRENQLFRAQLNQKSDGLDSQQLNRWRASQAEFRSRIAAARLEVSQLQEQLRRTKIQLADSRSSLETQIEIRDSLQELVEVGGISRLQYVQQKQQVDTQKAEVEQLVVEEKRLEFDIAQAKQELANTIATTGKDLLDNTGNNLKSIAEIDSQLTKILVENKRRLAEIQSEISQAELTLKYQEVRAPVNGVVFDLKAGEGFVPAPSQAETLLKIVPGDDLIAEIYVNNEDIGFVAAKFKQAQENQVPLRVDVRIDSFPFSEFGDIKGEVMYVADDALPPDEIYNFYHFPVRIKMDRQFLEAHGHKINLQPGMSVSANIKIREERTVLSLFTDLFTKQVEILKEVR
ncbi:MAG: HlyD family efflux transporter periplasmic adaptor subunit [Prochloraceae cyanobacterium]|nr:HlyD family efflux transporter periplasmic adaptor subunit [Prochloraceae cyanobacterium]